MLLVSKHWSPKRPLPKPPKRPRHEVGWACVGSTAPLGPSRLSHLSFRIQSGPRSCYLLRHHPSQPEASVLEAPSGWIGPGSVHRQICCPKALFYWFMLPDKGCGPLIWGHARTLPNRSGGVLSVSKSPAFSFKNACVVQGLRSSILAGPSLSEGPYRKPAWGAI